MLGNGESQNERRRRITKESQALPLFMTAGKSRVSEPVMMSASTSREMQRYLRWAAEVARMGRDDAQVMMLDRAIVDYLKRDEAWQAYKASTDSNDGGDDATADPAPATGNVRITPAPRPAAPPAGPRPGDGQGDIGSKAAQSETGGPKAK
jgi:hypothetical protein